MFWYFGYGSNMALGSLRAKGVVPRQSEPAVLRGWRRRFNVQHFFLHEGGVGNIEPSVGAADRAADQVWGVVHLCEDAHLALLDATEAHGHGYQRVDVLLHTDHGERSAIAYVGMPSFINDACRPTQRYLNILLRGAEAAGLDADTLAALKREPVHVKQPVPRFAPPAGDFPEFNAATLAAQPSLTALDGAVFDMSRARWQHQHLMSFFGGRDMTLFHLQRLDSSDGRETLDDIRSGRLNATQRLYLDEYLHEYAREYVYCGRYRTE